MTEQINIDPDELRRAADEHRRTAEQLSEVPSSHGGIMASLESLGPVFAELRDAGYHLLEQRRTCYLQQAAAHAELAGALVHAADVWEAHDAAAAQTLRAIHPE